LGPTIVIAYLIKDRGMTLKHAMDFLITDRGYKGCVLSENIQIQLEMFQNKIREIHGMI